MKNITYEMKILTEKLEFTKLNVIYALMLLDNTTEMFIKISNDVIGMNNLVES